MERPGRELPDGSSESSQLSGSLVALAPLLLSEQTLEATLHRLVSLARDAMANVDGASISLLRSGQFTTATATTQEVRDADDVQYRSGRGPCLEAIRIGTTVNAHLTETRANWPEFSDAALAAGYRGVLSTPMAGRQSRLAGLNLYSRTRERFDAADEQAARAFADQAVLVLANAAAFAAAELLNRQLSEAVSTRDIIGLAKGILLAERGISADEAFAVLRKTAQSSNQRLRDVAAEMVRAATHETGGHR